MNTSVKVVLYTSKTLSNGEHPVMLRVIKERKAKYLSTGFSCPINLWNEKENLPRKTHPHYMDAKILISKKVLDAEKMIIGLENENLNLSSYEIKQKLRKERSNNQSVLDYFDVVITRYLNSGQIKNSEVYKDSKRSLLSFTQSKTLHFSDIEVQFLNKYEEHLRSTGKKPNTIYLYLRTLRALINKAIKEDFCSDKYYGFKKFSLAKYSKTKTEKRAIGKEEIEKIRFYDFQNHPEFIDSKSIFLFSFYCRGINFIDIALLKWKNIKNDRLIYTRQKTREYYSMELLEPAKEILDYYKLTTFESQEDYIFPILNKTHKTPKAIYNRKIKMLKRVNSELKDIAKLVGIDTELTTYVARHSYATILKKNGISTAVISEALGHGSEKTTQIYLDSFENYILDQASKLIL